MSVQPNEPPELDSAPDFLGEALHEVGVAGGVARSLIKHKWDLSGEHVKIEPSASDAPKGIKIDVKR